MKIHSLLAEILIFLLVNLFFIIPPIGNSIMEMGEVISFTWEFPFPQMIFALCALFILFLHYKSNNFKVNIFGFRIIFTVGLLFASLLFINFLSLVIPIGYEKDNITFTLPNSLSTWIYCILNFFFAAFYEEVIYRLYFTDSLISIFTKISPIFNKKIFIIIFEILGCVVFAFGHGYLGVFAVLNAAIAHFILRYTYKKSNSIIPGFIAHFIYNMISLILS